MAAQIRAGEIFDAALQRRKSSEKMEETRKRPHTEVAINDAPGRRGIAIAEGRGQNLVGNGATLPGKTDEMTRSGEGRQKDTAHTTEGS